jgi:ankyrin repeat protein
VESLLRHGADPNGIEWGDMTALAWAARNGYVEVIGTLLQAGADPNLLSPLVAAAKGGSTESVRLLLDHGARPSSEALDWAEQLATAEPGSASHAEVAEILRSAVAGS